MEGRKTPTWPNGSKEKRRECFPCVSLVALMSFMLTPWRSPWRNDAFASYFRGRIGDELRKVRIDATSPRGVPVLEVLRVELCVFLSVEIKEMAKEKEVRAVKAAKERMQTKERAKVSQRATVRKVN